MVRAVARELLDQVAIGAVNLGAVKARTFGHLCPMLERSDHVLDFGRSEAARRHAFDLAVLRVGGAAGVEAVAGRHRQRAVGLHVRMRNGADVPELGHDLAAFGVHRVSREPPAGLLFGAVDARRTHITLARWQHLGALGDDQSGTGALCVVLGDQRVGGVGAWRGATAGQRRHEDAVGNVNGANAQRRKQGRGIIGHAKKKKKAIRGGSRNSLNFGAGSR